MRTNRAIIASLCLLVVFGFGEVFAQGVDFNFIGAGARARGMGGAFIGVADDATAISWNPAGLATLERAEASAVGYYSIQKYEFKDEFTWEAISGSQSGSGTYEESSSQSHPSFNFGSLAFPLTAGSNNIVVAAAYQRLIDLYDLYQDSTLTQEYKGGVDVISPGAAIQIVPEFAIGAAFNIWTGSVDYTLDYEASDNNDVDINNLAKFSGFNVNIGALATFDKFKIGAVAKTPLSLTEKWKPADTEFEYKFKFPMTFGFGISFQPNDNLTLAADVDVRPYSNTDIEDVENDTTYTAEYDNTTQFRVGMEYLVITESNVFPVRLGFHTDPLIQNPFYPLSDEKTTGLFFSGGFGVIVGNIWFDAAYELGMLKATLDDYESTDGTYNYVDNLEYKEMTHNIILSAIVHF